MSDFEFLLAVLAAIYLAECVWVLGPGVTLVRVGLNRHGRVTKPVDRRTFRLTGLIPYGWGGLLEPWPVTVSPEAVCWRQPGPEATVHLVRLSDLDTVTAQDRSILVNNTMFAKTTSRAMAARAAALIEKLRTAHPDDRPSIIHEAMAASLDPAAVQTRLSAIVPRLGPLQLACTGLWVCLFVALPLLNRWTGMPEGLWWVLPWYGLCLTAIMVLYGRSGRTTAGAGRYALKTAAMALAPTSAMRAGHSVMREHLADFHPLAVARVLDDDASFLELAGSVVREARYSGSLRDQEQDEAVRRTEAWFAESLNQQLDRFLADCGMAPEQLLAPPAAESSQAVAYCPRCCAQFTDPQARCGPCGDRKLVAFG